MISTELFDYIVLTADMGIVSVRIKEMQKYSKSKLWSGLSKIFVFKTTFNDQSIFFESMRFSNVCD
jgi:hypothetical protein